MISDEKENAQLEQTTEQVEDAPLEELGEAKDDVLHEEDIAKVKKAIDQAHMDASLLSDHDKEILRRIHEEAKLPIELNDKDFKMGEQELDVRKLSRANWRQMNFREQILTNIYLKQIAMGQTDILRLLMVIADKLGVEDIVQATDDVIDKVEEAEKLKRNKNTN